MSEERTPRAAFHDLTGELAVTAATTSGFLLEPIAANRGTPLEEFTFRRARRIDPGHEA